MLTRYIVAGNQIKCSNIKINKFSIYHTAVIEKDEEEKEIQEESKRQEQRARSIIAVYPERVAELWDYEKNGDLKPEDVSAGTVLQYIWLKCPI